MSEPTPAGGSLLLTRTRRKTRLAFATIYIAWGVSYAVNRIMALSLPPLLAAGSRFLLAACFLLAVARWRGLPLPRGRRDWWFLLAAAVLGIVLSNGLSVFSLQHIASNQAALITASAAFWIAWLGMYGRRATPVSARTWAGLVIGFVGVALLVSARGFGAQAQIGWQLLMLVSALCWALASMVIRESHSASDPLAFTACYLLIGGSIMLALGFAHGDAARWNWSPTGIGAIVFLAIVSSTFGFVSYAYLLRHESPSRVGTYAYVNPLVAVFCGWLLLNERLDAVQLLGSAVIFAGVLLVGDLRLLPRGSAVPDTTSASESHL
ncbi:MAG: EamA family transporter [Proteobacteria bacterium]|nr:EamA family transporter [Pseudomonadota bacterium]